MALITAVFLAKQAGITPEKFRRALRKRKRGGASDLKWHHPDGAYWQADDVSAPERIASMKRVLREISE